MCGGQEEREGSSDDDWEGFLEEQIEVPTDGPIPMDWPSTEDLKRLLTIAGSKWDAANLEPPSQDGVLLPPGYYYAGGDDDDDDGDKTMDEAVERFARDWRRELRDTSFRSQPHLSPTAREDLDAFLRTGTSGNRNMKLQALLLKPNQVFGMHAHPTMELECTLRGALGEVRLVGQFTEPLDIPYRGPWPERPDSDENKSLQGPDLQSLTGPYAELPNKATWTRMESVTCGNYLLNEVGSIHKSFTEDEPFCCLVLWGGIHATVDSEKEGTAIPNSNLLKMTFL